MSIAVRSYHSKLFSAQERSDCTIEFACGQCEDEAVAPARKRRRTDRKANCGRQTASDGNAIPAHLFIVCPGSAYFDALADRWAKEQDGKPVLRVRLETIEDLPHAKAAIEFMYTGQCKGLGAEDLLRLRRVAAFLQVEGCVEACDDALVGLVASDTQQAQQQQSSDGEPTASALTGLLQLFASRHLLPDPAEDPTAAALTARVLAASGKQLSQYMGDAKATFGSVSLGDLLIWAFPSAPEVLNDPESLQAAQALPAPMLEALLGHDSFATDSEDSVLLLLAYWVQANPNATEAALAPLCRLIRLLHLTDAFRCALLPELPWFPIKSEEHRFLCTYTASPPAKRLQLAWCTYQYGCCESPWYKGEPRPKPMHPAGGRRYEWYLRREQLQGLLRSDQLWPAVHPTLVVLRQCAPATPVQGQDRDQERQREHIIAGGLVWRVKLQHNKGCSGASLFLECSLPEPFRSLDAGLVWLPRTSHLGPSHLAIWRKPADGGAGGDAQRRECLSARAYELCGPTVHVPLEEPRSAAPAEGGRASRRGQQRQQREPQQGDDDAVWEPYVMGDRMCGTLTLG